MGATCGITVLVAQNGFCAAKQFMPDGTVKPYNAGVWFHHRHIELTGIESLAATLSQLERDSRALVIRGRLRPEIDASHIVARRKNPKGGHPQYFEPCDRHWVMLDVDGLEAPEGVSPVSDEAIAFAIEQLPPEFHDVSCFYQWSSSAGRAGQTIKLHLWFWLDRATPDSELRRWARTFNATFFNGNRVIDSAVFEAVQAHYTAAPLFHDGLDPLACRSGLLRKRKDVVSLSLATSDEALRPLRRGTMPAGDYEVDAEGLLADGREGWLLGERLRVLREEKPECLDEFCELVWHSFRRHCRLDATPTSSNAYTYEDVAQKCRADWEKRDQLTSGSRNPVVPPQFTTQRVDVETGTRRLQDLVTSFFETPRHMAVRITSGAGKTSQVCRLLGQHHKPGQVVHFYVPTHRLAEDVAEHLAQFAPSLRVLIHKGRSAENCQRYDRVQEAIKNGLPVQQTCCEKKRMDGTVSRCPFFEQCSYQQQAAPRFDVYVFTHQYLVQPRRPTIPPADINIVDERFYGELIQTKTLELDRLNAIPDDLLERMQTDHLRYNVDAVIRRALEAKTPLLAALRQAGIDANDLHSHAKAPHRDWARNFVHEIAPDQDDGPAIARMQWFGGLPAKYYLYRELKRELDQPRDGSYAVGLDRQDVVVRWRNKHRLRAPTLILDATADKRILELVMGDIEFHAIDVERRARVVQIKDRRLSRYAVTDSRGAEQAIEAIKDALDRLADRHRSALVVTFKDLKAELALPKGWHVEHYGNVRGVDTYKDTEAVIIIGTFLPPVQAMETQAAALAADSNITLNLTGEYVDAPRGYTLRSGEHAGAVVRVHPDPLVQAFLEQQREAEMLQAIDRLRLIHCKEPKQVYILANVPLDLPVDQLIELSQLTGKDKLEQLLGRFDGLVPLVPEWLHERASDLFASAKAAARWMERKIPHGANIYSIRQAGVFLGAFRKRGQRGRESRFVADRAHPAPHVTLRQHLPDVDKYDGLPDREVVEYVTVPGLEGSFPCRLRQFVPDQYIPGLGRPVALPPDLYRVLNPPLIIIKRDDDQQE